MSGEHCDECGRKVLRYQQPGGSPVVLEAGSADSRYALTKAPRSGAIIAIRQVVYLEHECRGST